MAASKRELYLLGTGATALGRGIELASSFAILWLLTHLFGVEGYGDLVLALAIVEIVAALATGGLEGVILYRSSRSDLPPGALDDGSVASAVLGWGLLVSLLLGLAVWALAPLLAAAFGKAQAAFWIAALAASIPVQVARALYAAWHRSRQRIPEAALLGQALPRLATALALGGIVAFAPGPAGVAAALVCAPLLVLLPWFARAPLNPLRSGWRLRGWDLRYALGLSFNRLLQRGITGLDFLLRGALATSAATGLYAVASRVALLTPSVFNLLIPTFASRIGYLLGSDRRQELEREYDQTRGVGFLGALLVASVVGSFAAPLLGLFGDFEAAEPVLLVLTSAWLAQASFGMNRSYLGMAGYGGWALATSSLLLLCNVALNILLIPRYGALGAAIASFVSIVGSRSVVSWIVWRLDGFRTYPAEVAAIALAAVCLLWLRGLDLFGAPLLGLGLLLALGLLVRRERRHWEPHLDTALARIRRARAAD